MAVRGWPRRHCVPARTGLGRHVNPDDQVALMTNDNGRPNITWVTRTLQPTAGGPLKPMLHPLGQQEAAISSRWQHDAVPLWRRLPSALVCETEATTADGGRWLRQPATFLCWRPNLGPDDCSLDQLRQ
jgi:hypothetical protein